MRNGKAISTGKLNDDYDVRLILVDGSIVDLHFKINLNRRHNNFVDRKVFNEFMFGDTDKKFIRIKYYNNLASQDGYIFKDKIVQFFINPINQL